MRAGELRRQEECVNFPSALPLGDARLAFSTGVLAIVCMDAFGKWKIGPT
jgi:hypothetical protein